jgi:hypothetical protein
MRCLGEWAEARGLTTTDGQGLIAAACCGCLLAAMRMASRTADGVQC